MIVVFAKSKINLAEVVLFFCLAFLSFRVVSLGLVFAVLFLFMVVLTRKLSYRLSFSAIAVLGFYIIYALFGVGNYEEGGGALIKLVIIFALPSILMLYLGSLNRTSDIVTFSVLNLLFSYTVVIYSYYKGYYGYGELRSPLTGELSNSPSYVILIFISTVVLCEKFRVLFGLKGCWLAMLLLIFVFFSCSVYMQSRFSVVALVAYVPLLFRGHVKLFGLGVLVSAVLLYSINFDFSGLSELLHRFDRSGLESPRLAMYKYGVKEMFNMPFGGMKVINAGAGYQGVWFHNLYLDIARVAGLPALMFWVMLLMAFLLRAFFTLDKPNLSFYLVVFLFLNIALSQNLGFDGYYNYVLYFFYLFGLSISGGFERESKPYQPVREEGG